MKPLLILLAFVATIFTKASAADGGAVTPLVLQSFHTTFTTAKDVAWTTGADFYKASFDLSGQKITAYYNCDGKMMGLTRNMSSLQLPVALQAALKKDYSDHWITDLFEMTTDSGTAYYVTLETADGKVVLKSNATTNWSLYQRGKKA